MTFRGQVQALSEIIGTARLSPWADAFIEAIADRQARGMKITARQREIIRELYDRNFQNRRSNP